MAFIPFAVEVAEYGKVCSAVANFGVVIGKSTTLKKGKYVLLYTAFATEYNLVYRGHSFVRTLLRL